MPKIEPEESTVTLSQFQSILHRIHTKLENYSLSTATLVEQLRTAERIIGDQNVLRASLETEVSAHQVRARKLEQKIQRLVAHIAAVDDDDL